MVEICCCFFILVAAGCRDEPVQFTESVSSVSLIITDTIGVELGDSSYVFGYAVDCVRTDSLIYILDMSRAKLQMYYPDGSYYGFAGGGGQGPGELLMPHCIEMLPDGSFLIQDVMDLGLYSPDGEWQSHILTHSGNWPSQHTIMGDSIFAVRWHEFVHGNSNVLRQFIASYDLQGEMVTEYMSDPISLPVAPEENNDALNRSFFSHYFAGDLNGNLYMVRRSQPGYSVFCLDSDGVPFDTLSIEVPTVYKSPEEMEIEKAYIEDYLTGMGTSNVLEWVYEPDPVKPAIAGLWLGWENNLWVLRGYTEKPVFDVWQVPEGEYLFTAELDLELPPDELLTFYITPWCRDFLAVHEDPFMVQRVLLIGVE